MATEDAVVDMSYAESRKASTELCDDLAWQELDGLLPIGVWRRLMVVKRSLLAANRISQMLLEDYMGNLRKEECGDEFEGLTPSEEEALRIAALELGDRAERMLTEVQENAHGCVGKLPK